MNVSRVFDILPHIKSNFNHPDVLAAKENGQWRSYSIDEIIDKVNAVSYGLMALGVKKGDRVSIMSANRPEWNIADLGIAQLGAVSVPVYPTVSEHDLAYILADAEVKVALVSDADLYQKTKLARQIKGLNFELYAFDQFEGGANWQELMDLGNQHQNPEQLELAKSNVDTFDLLTLIYTSGTTGEPKGVMLSHQNLISNVLSSKVVCPIDYNHRALSFLPLSHIFERMLVYLYLYVGTQIYYAESMEKIADNLKEVKPYVFSTVPRLLEKVYDKIIAKGTELTGIKKSLFFWAVDLGLKYEYAEKNGAWYEFKLKIARKIIFSKWLEALGGNVGLIVTGAAALQPRLARVFSAAGINVWEGYGLTETSPVICVNNLVFGRQFGTVGAPIPGVEIKLAEDGEILTKGPNVMMGYYKKPEITAEVIKDGWFHTGDIGVMEEGKYLKITDRKKEIFKTSGGKYIAPQLIENKLKESIYIEQVMVVGSGQKYAAAVVVPAFLALKDWAEKNGLADLSNNALIKNEQVLQLIQNDIDETNKGLGNWETIKKFCLLPSEWTIDGLELTPTLKLKRKIITQKYQSEIDSLFD